MSRASSCVQTHPSIYSLSLAFTEATPSLFLMNWLRVQSASVANSSTAAGWVLAAWHDHNAATRRVAGAAFSAAAFAAQNSITGEKWQKDIEMFEAIYKIVRGGSDKFFARHI